MPNLTELINYPSSNRGKFNTFEDLYTSIPVGRRGDFAFVGLPYKQAHIVAFWDSDSFVWQVSSDVDYNVITNSGNVDYVVPYTDFVYGKQFINFNNIDPINIILPNNVVYATVPELRVGQYFTFCKITGTGTITVVGDNGAIVNSRVGLEITNDHHVYTIMISELMIIGSTAYISYRLIG